MILFISLLQAFVRWFLLVLASWFMKNLFDSVVRPWLSEPLRRASELSSQAHAKFLNSFRAIGGLVVET